MDPALHALIATPYQSMGDVVASLTGLEAYFLDRRDRRAVFVSAYNQVSKAIGQSVATKTFHDPAWVEHHGMTFAELYRQALLAFETGTGTLPSAWKISFTESKAGRLLIIQDLILGIHAHVNHDLAWALAGLGIDPDRPTRYADHTKVNDILDGVTNALQARIEHLYSRGLGTLDQILGPLDESFSSFSVRVAREVAWQNGVALVDAATGSARASVGARIDKDTKVMANLILRPNVKVPWIIEAARSAEEVLGWMDVVAT